MGADNDSELLIIIVARFFVGIFIDIFIATIMGILIYEDDSDV
ncbi:MAG: hypothetical protein RIS17_386, partial [Pseudomonadota bacterium]